MKKPKDWNSDWIFDKISKYWLKPTKCNLCDHCKEIILENGLSRGCLYGGPFESYYEEKITNGS